MKDRTSCFGGSFRWPCSVPQTSFPAGRRRQVHSLHLLQVPWGGGSL